MRTADWFREGTKIRLHWTFDEKRKILRPRLFIGNIWLLVFVFVTFVSASTLLR